MSLCQPDKRSKMRIALRSGNLRSYMGPRIVHSPYFIIIIILHNLLLVWHFNDFHNFGLLLSIL
jgi:hypothetical protein